MKFFCLLLLAMTTNVFAKNPVVEMKTSLGDIEIELNQEKAPITVANFLKYVDDKFYEGTVFHRVINGFMIQGGGMTADMSEKTTRAPIKNEATNGLTNEAGTIAMARTPMPHTASSQFFINVNNNASLNNMGTSDAAYGYAVFGKVIKGMDVVNRIKMVKTTTKGQHRDVPVDAVVIKSVKRK